MASSRRVPTNATINSYGTGKDYTSLSTWEAATDVGMVATTTSYILEVYGNSYNDGNCILSGAAGDTDENYYRVIRPASGNFLNTGAISTKHFARTSSSSYNIIGIQESYSEAQDIVASLNCSYSTLDMYLFRCAGFTGAGFVGCVAIDSTNTYATKTFSGFYIGASTGGTAHAINCIAHNCEGHGFLLASVESNIFIYNCTSVGNGGYGFKGNSSTYCKCYGCGADGNSSGDFDSANLTLTNCSDSTPTFAAGTDNFHLDATDTVWKDADTNTGSWHSSCGYDDDVDGDTRTGSWDIGWDEVTGGGATSLLNSLLRKPFRHMLIR